MLIVTVIGVLLSYNANKGLPYVPVVPDHRRSCRTPPSSRRVARRYASAAHASGSSRRSRRCRRPARIRSARGSSSSCRRTRRSCPSTRASAIRPRSILGAKYLDVIPGKSARGIPPGGAIPPAQAEPIVELDEAFNVFDDETSRGPAQRDHRARRRPRRPWRRAQRDDRRSPPSPCRRPSASWRSSPTRRRSSRASSAGSAPTSCTLRPVAPALPRLLDNGATTLAAINRAGPALERPLDELPQTESRR